MMRGMLVLALAFGAAACRSPEPETRRVERHGLWFTDVTREAGLADFRHVTGAFGKKWFPETMGSGCGFLDYDGDGWQDVVLVGGGVWPDSDSALHRTIWLFRNEGDGTFTDVTEETGLGRVNAYGIGIAAADIDNDGDVDLYLTTLGRNLLLRNDDGHFVEVGETAGVAGDPVWSSSAIFFDADRDGDVDLYSGNYVRWSPETDIFCSLGGGIKDYCTPETYEGIPSRFYRNRGDGTFDDATQEVGFLPAPGKTLGVTELDYNQDGWPDLAVANDTQRDLLYENNGDGTFTERGTIAGTAYDENGQARAGMGIDAGVVDSTGAVTLFVGNFSKEMIGVYRYERAGMFQDRAALSRVGRTSLMTLTFALFLLDADLDGDLDLYAANGHVQPEIETAQQGIGYAEPPHLFLNRGDGEFEDVAQRIGLTDSVVARGAAYADFDRDGDLDILLTENSGPAHLLRNETVGPEGPHYLRVKLQGGPSNRNGLSSRVIAVAGGRRMIRRVRTGSSYLSQSELPVTFGVGTITRVDTLTIEWPSGTVDRFSDVAADEAYLAVEGATRLNAVRMGRTRHAERVP